MKSFLENDSFLNAAILYAFIAQCDTLDDFWFQRRIFYLLTERTLNSQQLLLKRLSMAASLRLLYLLLMNDKDSSNQQVTILF